MRLVIVGAGGTGGYFGAKLAKAGEDVTFLARGAHLAAIREHGIRIRSKIEGEWSVTKAIMSRSARVLMEGTVRVPGDSF